MRMVTSSVTVRTGAFVLLVSGCVCLLGLDPDPMRYGVRRDVYAMSLAQDFRKICAQRPLNPMPTTYAGDWRGCFAPLDYAKS